MQPEKPDHPSLRIRRRRDRSVESRDKADAAARATGAITQIIELQYKERTFFAVKKDGEDGEYLNPKNTEGCDASAWEIREVAQEFASDTNDCDPSLETNEFWFDVVGLEIKPIFIR